MGRPRIVEGGVLLPLSPKNEADDGDEGGEDADEGGVDDSSSLRPRRSDHDDVDGPASTTTASPPRRRRRGPMRTARIRTAVLTASASAGMPAGVGGGSRSGRGGGRGGAAAATSDSAGGISGPSSATIPIIGTAAAVASEQSVGYMEFPRRYPRIGNAFQAKWIPSLVSLVAPSSSGGAVVSTVSSTQASSSASSPSRAARKVPQQETYSTTATTTTAPTGAYVSSRPKPLLFSTEYPHCTIEQVESYEEDGPAVMGAEPDCSMSTESFALSSPSAASDDDDDDGAVAAEAESTSDRMVDDGIDNDDNQEGTPSPATSAATAATAPSTTLGAEASSSMSPGTDIVNVKEPGIGSMSGSDRPGRNQASASTALTRYQDAFVNFVAPIFLYEEEDDDDDDPGDRQPSHDDAANAMGTAEEEETDVDPLQRWVWRVVDWHHDQQRPPVSVKGAAENDANVVAARTSSTGRRLKSTYRAAPLANAATRQPSPPVKRGRPTLADDGIIRPGKRYKCDDALREFWRQHSGSLDDVGATTTANSRRSSEDGTADLWQQRACQLALVSLCGGQARVAFRHAKRSRALITAGNASWRNAVTFSAPVAYGDFRRYQHPPLAYVNGRVDPASTTAAPTFEWAEAKPTTHNASIPEWKALLALGQNLLDELSTTKLSEVTQFCLCMSRVFLPPPDTTDLNLQMDAIMEQLVGAVETCRSEQAYVVDAMFSDPDDPDDDGVDTDELQRLIDAATQASPCVLDWADEQRRMVEAAQAWEQRVEEALSFEAATTDGGGVCAGGDLEVLEQLVVEAKHSLSFRTTTLVELEERLEKAYELRRRIRTLLDNHEAPEPLKTLGSVVRDATKLRVTFAEIRRLIQLHAQTEAWVDRANIAIRSRISLSEIKELLRQASELPVDLSEYTEKLLSRERVADEWILRFSSIVPHSNTIQQMSFVRRLLDTKYHALHELASDGSRIPVEVETVNWLQVELDGRNWSFKARKLIPGYEDSKKCRLEDLQEHLSKAVALRDRLTNLLTEEEKQQWSLDGEPELRSLVADVERWFVENKDYIDGDNRKGGSRPSLSIAELRQIVETGNAIYAHLGNALTKVSRILQQAEDWQRTYQSLVTRCTTGEQVEVSELMNAVSSANSDVALDLHEAQELGRLSEKAQAWFEAAEIACGRRKPSRHKKAMTLEALKELIEEAKHLPVDTSEFEQELLTQLQLVEEWQARSVEDIEEIVTAFEKLRGSLRDIHGEPADFVCGSTKRTDSTDEIELSIDGSKAADDTTVSSLPLSTDQTTDSNVEESKVTTLVSRFLKECQAKAIRTPECEVAQEADTMCKWLAKSIKYLETHRDVFDRRFIGAFDRFMAEGKDHLALTCDETSLPLSPALARLKESVLAVVKDQDKRLHLLLEERERYTAWCNAVNAAVEEGKLPIERLCDMAKESRGFPVTCDTTRKVQRLEEKALQWVEVVRQQLASQDKLPVQEAKSLLDEGDKLDVVSGELKTLRSALKTANAWANRVRRCKPESGKQNSKSIQELLDEHEALQVCMPDEVKKLKKALKAFCICRRPYDGFMVGCDSCDEWFHGPCVGISESKAEKVDKYECVRCLLVKMFNTSAATIAGVIRKWTNVQDCRKARQVGSQKLQRKLRKELKEMEELNKRREMAKEEIRVAKSAQAPLPVVTAASTAVVVPDSSSADPPGMDGDEAQAAIDINGSAESIQPTSAPLSVEAATAAVESLELKLVALEKSLVQAEGRLNDVRDAIAQRRNEEEIEDANADLLRRFCVVVRTLVLIPSTPALVDAAHPLHDGDLSLPMKNVIDQAQAAGLERFRDVRDVINSFRCMCWSLRARDLVSKHPQFDEVHSLVRRAADSSMRLPDEKALRILRGMSQRALAWQIRVMKAIAPIPGESRPFDLSHLRELAKLAEDIPLSMPFESRLAATIDDAGHRHCVCGGPSDGRVMLSCDLCERWFHCSCIGLSKAALNDLGEWKCPLCSGAVCDPAQVRVEEFHNQFDCTDESTESDDDSSSEPEETLHLWPPFGMLGSERSLVAIGKTACDIPPLFHIEDPKPTSSVPLGETPGHAVPPLSSSTAPQPPTVQTPHMYSPPHHFYSVAPGPYATLHPAAPSSFAPSQATVSTPPRAPSNQPVVFGSPGVTVLSPGTLASASVQHAPPAFYSASVTSSSPAAFMNVAHYPHATHSLFQVNPTAHPFHAAFMTGYPGGGTIAAAELAKPSRDVAGPDGEGLASKPFAATGTDGPAEMSTLSEPDAAGPLMAPNDAS